MAQSNTTPFRKTKYGKLTRNFLEKLRALRKACYWRLRKAGAKRVVFILGCQRSGTGILSGSLSRDLNVTLFQETSAITGSDGGRLRLKPFAEVQRILDQCRTPIVVAKPLVESQHALRLLAAFPGSKVVWMYRGFADVVASKLKRFKKQIDHIRSVVELRPGDWRSEQVSEHTRGFLARFFSEDMSRADAAALMWYARNTLFFEQGLDNRADVTLCRYEDLVEMPGKEMRALYQWLELTYPGDSIVRSIDAQSVGGGTSMHLAPEIENTCSDLLRRLDERYGAIAHDSAARASSVLSKATASHSGSRCHAVQCD